MANAPMEPLVVILLIAAAALLVLRRLWLRARGRADSSCGSCKSCGDADPTCDPAARKDPPPEPPGDRRDA